MGEVRWLLEAWMVMSVSASPAGMGAARRAEQSLREKLGTHVIILRTSSTDHQLRGA